MAARLHGRRILVTGAASGMGRAIAEMFGAEGAALALLDLNDDGVQAVASELSAVGYACDVSDRLAVMRWWPNQERLWVGSMASLTPRAY